MYSADRDEIGPYLVPLSRQGRSGTCNKSHLCTIHTAGKIRIEHVTIFLSKYILKGSIDMTFSPDVGNNPGNPKKPKQINSEIKLCVLM